MEVAMQRSLVSKLLGIFTTSEVHELIDVFKGKGRRNITPYLEDYLQSISAESSSSSNKEPNLASLRNKKYASKTIEQSDEISKKTDNQKGVLFILESFRKTKKYQNMLKSREVMNLYGHIKTQPISKIKDVESNLVAKSKGILVNKKHY